MQRTISSEPEVAIIGAGPVGLFAAFELGMLGIRCHILDALPDIGGQCTALYPEKPIFDIPGYPSIDAADLIKNLGEQAAPFSPIYHLDQQVTSLKKLETGNWRLETSKNTNLTVGAVIIAAGCGAFGPNRPPMQGLEAYEGRHVHYLVTNKEQFRGQKLVIAGGGDSAVDWANALADVAQHIYMVHRRDKFRAAPESVAQMKAKANVELVVPYQLDALEGDNKTLRGVTVATLEGEKRLLEADHLLAFFGLSMELGPIANWGLNLDHHHITIDRGTSATNAQGIFAIGDIATYEHKLKLILCGFAEAAQAAHAIRGLLRPGEAYHFEYSTTKGVPEAA
jgi:thioredoxin reductase (NADPH)